MPVLKCGAAPKPCNRDNKSNQRTLALGRWPDESLESVAVSIAYVASQDGLYVIDVSVPESPTIIGSVAATPGDYSSTRSHIAISDGKAYVSGGGSSLGLPNPLETRS